MKNTTTLIDCILNFPSRSGQNPAVLFKPAGGSGLQDWQSLSWFEYYEKAFEIASFLQGKGVHRGDRVAIASETQMEWAVVDIACMLLGVVVVPIYPSLSKSELAVILTQTQPQWLFLSSNVIEAHLPNLDLKNPLHIVHLPGFAPTLTTGKYSGTPWVQAEKEGRRSLTSHRDAILQTAKSLRPNDLLTIIFTSGTSGVPKGVLLTHEQAWSEVNDAMTITGVTPDDLSLSFLPYAHILGRIEHWGHIRTGFQLAFAENIDRLRHNLAEIKPTILIAVPRIFEKIHQGILARVQTKALENRTFKWAYRVASAAAEFTLAGQPIPVFLAAQLALARRLVLQPIREAFGGRLRFAISGGAPLAEDIMKFFFCCDILVLEGYGLSETTGAITLNTPYDFHFGSVGKPLGDVQLRLAADGEILVKSAKVTPGYFENSDATAAAFEDGWFRTGDIGEIRPSGELVIKDRKKDLIKTAGGKYVAPQKIEGLLKNSPLISQVVVHGDRRKYLVALLTLNRSTTEEWAQNQGLATENWAKLVDSIPVQLEIKRILQAANHELASFETIKRFTVLLEEFTIANGEMTPSLKVKRKEVERKYIHLLEQLYE